MRLAAWRAPSGRISPVESPPTVGADAESALWHICNMLPLRIGAGALLWSLLGLLEA